MYSFQCRLETDRIIELGALGFAIANLVFDFVQILLRFSMIVIPVLHANTINCNRRVALLILIRVFLWS